MSHMKYTCVFYRMLLVSYILCVTTHSVLAGKIETRSKKPKHHNIVSAAINDHDTTRYPGTTEIALNARQTIVIDYLTGQTLLAKNEHEKMAPSSMIKIMTSYIVEEKVKNGDFGLDSEFIVSEKAWKMEGTRSFMPLGKMVRLEDILRGIIVHSGNDASIVAAEGICGSEENFVDVMNDKAREMGMKDTVFMNVTGLPDKNQYSTVSDLATLSTALIRTHPGFYPIYSEISFTFGTDPNGNPITQGNRNPLLYKNVGCDGIKTGYTVDGGYGVAASFIDNQRRYIMVINGLSSMQKRADEATKIVHWVRQNFTNKRLYSKDDVVTEIPVTLGVKDTLPLTVKDDISMLALRSDKNKKADVRTEITQPIAAPIAAGDIIGKVIISVDNTTQSYDLVAKESVEKVGWLKQMIYYITYPFKH
jgi:D-alanyl-D-alanine carboxypeptidase (penicillin-binding protein 5/6)